MDQLSSCYFCGDALDASLEEHPVVPGELDPGPDTQQTVVLCQTCKRKLDAVLEAVVAAVDEGAVADGSTDADGQTVASGNPNVDATGEPSDIESTLGDDEDLLQPVGDEADDDGESASASDDEGDGSDADDEADDSDTDDDGRTYTSSRRAGYTGEERQDSSPVPGSDERSDGQERNEASDETNETANDETETSKTANAGETDGTGGSEPDVSLTRLENTKVMRLLKNREFPVERDDFVTVASSAYEVSPRNCDKVIDLAVEHDLLREEDGRLYAGSQWS